MATKGTKTATKAAKTATKTAKTTMSGGTLAPPAPPPYAATARAVTAYGGVQGVREPPHHDRLTERKRTGYENECHRRAKQESRAKVEADED